MVQTVILGEEFLKQNKEILDYEQQSSFIE